MIVQDVVNAVSIDTRQVLNTSGNDANVIMSWVDRVHKDVLHSTLYTNLNLGTTSIATVLNSTSYILTPPTTIRRIVSVYDTTFNMSLTPADAELDTPSPVEARVSEDSGRSAAPSSVVPHYQAYKFGGTPEYYRFIAPTTLLIRPAPETTAYIATLSIVYEQTVSTLSSLTASLLIPDDGLDVVCAGVNWMAMAYIGRPQEAMSWFQLYQQLKQGNRIGVMR
jgi:hypothetical protein